MSSFENGDTLPLACTTNSNAQMLYVTDTIENLYPSGPVASFRSLNTISKEACSDLELE